ncbi:MAG: hypothetical protein ACLSAP_07545 [Oscillospiraceae bacterium]
MLKLAEGIDPISEQAVEEDSVLNNLRLARCFFYTAGILQQVIDNGGEVGAKKAQKKLPFSPTPEQLAQVRLSDAPISLTAFTAAVNEVIDAEQMSKLSHNRVSDWLVQKGLLQEETLLNGRSTKIITDLAGDFGITRETRQNPYGKSYEVNLYSREAQQFLLDNLDSILQQP